MKSVSVIMSAYNEPLEWLQHSMDSILAQTFEAFEFIIVNDNPQRQELKDILKDYNNRDGRIRIIENEKNIGLTKSKNKGLQLAAGKYIAIMDADDIAMPERVQLQHQFLENNKDIFLVGTSVGILDQNGVLKEKVIKHKNHKQIVNDMFTGKLPFYHPTIMFRNEGFLYRENFSVTQDYDFYLVCLSKNKKFSNLKQLLLHYRLSDRSISMNKRRKQVLYKYLAFQFYYERQTKGKDSYCDIDFDNQEQVMRFLSIKPQELEVTILREQVIVALGGDNYAAARKAFNLYAKCASMSGERAILWVFVNMPFVYRLYRKLRYEILKF